MHIHAYHDSTEGSAHLMDFVRSQQEAAVCPGQMSNGKQHVSHRQHFSSFENQTTALKIQNLPLDCK